MTVDEEMRQRAVEYLLEHKKKQKREDQFTARELIEILGLKKHEVYEYMEKLVKQGTWETGEAVDPFTNRLARVWWMKLNCN